MNLHKIHEYGGKVLDGTDGTLEMRDPNDNAHKRFQYRLIDGQPCRRTLPECGDYAPPAEWEPLDLTAMIAVSCGAYHPICDYFGSAPVITKIKG
jgi:hypothetical protein